MDTAPTENDDNSDNHAARVAIDALNAEAWDIRNISNDLSFGKATEAYEASLRLGYKRGQAYAAATLGVRANFFGNVEETMRYGLEALQILEAEQDEVGLGRVYFLLSFAHWGLGNYSEGMEYALRSFDAARASGDKSREAWSLYSLGTFYYDLQDFAQSLEYYNQAMEVTRHVDEHFIKARVLTGIGNVCLGLGDYDRAEQYLLEGLDLSYIINNPPMTARVIDDLGLIAMRRGNVERADELFAESLRLREETRQRRGVITTLINLASLRAQQQRVEEAIEHLQRALAIAEDLAAKPRMYRIHQLFAEIYEQAGNDSRALWHFKTYHRLKDEVTGDQQNLRYKTLQTRHQADRAAAEAEIFRLKNVELAQANEELAQAYKLVENERSRAETLLLNVLPPSIASRIQTGETVIADRFEDVTVLFVDIVNFTQLSARNEPEEMVEMLNWVFSVFDNLTERFGLEKIKTIGDAYMIASGIPTPRPDHAEAAARMALVMVDEFRTFSLQAGLQTTVRVGIHSGPVVAGVIGKKKFIYDLWGDTVNTASRMESHGEAGKIHLSEDVVERLAGKGFLFEQRSVMEIKGKGMMQTYFLVGEQRT
jgi:class 3 adenylate cyclase